MSSPTIRDVAERAGVSLTTVSYVLSGRSGGTTRISPSTQERVLAAVDDLGYVPNHAARGMRRGRTDLVAIAIEDLEWPPDRALAMAAAAILPQHGYQPVILLGQSWRQFMLAGCAAQAADASSSWKRLSGHALFGGGALQLLNEVLSAAGVFAEQIPTF